MRLRDLPCGAVYRKHDMHWIKLSKKSVLTNFDYTVLGLMWVVNLTTGDLVCEDEDILVYTPHVKE
jgi:hypothetical protein